MTLPLYPAGPYAGFCLTVNVVPDPVRARRAIAEAQRWEAEAKAWRERFKPLAVAGRSGVECGQPEVAGLIPAVSRKAT